MGSLSQIEHEHFVGDGLTNGTGQLHRRLLELLRVQHRLHRDGSGLGIRYLNTDSSLAGDRRDDTDTQSREAQGDIVLQVADTRDTHTRGWGNLIQRDGRTYGSLDA